MANATYTNTPTPEFEHDCTTCTFLGTVTAATGRIVDLWFHDGSRGGERTAIARFTSDGPDYVSGPQGAHPWADVAWTLAGARGFSI